ncbi:MAG TPA: cytochrome c3 family protein [Planctomycetota bacterium]
MALLSRSLRPAGVLAGLVLAALAGCSLVETLLPEAQPEPFAFSHRLHVEAAALACTDCHAPGPDGEPGWPAPADCARCHAEEASVPPERRVAALFEGERYRAARVGAQADEIVFAHAPHAASLDCASCHATVAADDGGLATLRGALVLSMDACLACHADHRAAPQEVDCAACHVEIRADRAPPSHALAWTSNHGLVARARSGARLDRCAMCHAESSCDACHQTQLPESHDNFFRRRGHGLQSSLDRASCDTCHDPDSCSRCHAETRPLSHTGSFGAPRDRHCLTCHEPLRSTSCGVCHADTPSHDLATPLPPDHVPSMNCRLCHGNGQPLPHVDNGQTCTSCHR